MASIYRSVPTRYGQARLADALQSGTPVGLFEMALGDGNGAIVSPNEDMKDLVREVYRGAINEIERIDTTTIRVALRVPSEVGGFTVREVGLYDDSGEMVAVGNYAATYKPLPEDGSVRELYVRMWLKVSSVDQVAITVDTSIIYATKEWTSAYVIGRAATDAEIDEGVEDTKFLTPRRFDRVRKLISGAIQAVSDALTDHRKSGDHDERYARRINNLSDLPSPSQARSNLGLGASATMGTTASRTSSSTATVLQAKAMNDHRQSDDHDGRYPLKEEVFPATVQIEDWNDTPNVNCFLRALGGNTPNKPPNTAGTYGWQLCSSAEGTYKQQFCSNLADNSVYTRAFINGVWQPWYPIFHRGNQFALGVSAESAREALQLGSSARLNAGEATGDVMLVGAFGVGNDGNINVPDNNANTITRSGVYRAYSATVGMPYTALWQLQHWVQGSNVAVQIAMESGSSLSSRAFMRTCNTEREWSPWQQLLTDRDTQQTYDDQTVGSLLTVGAFGLGGPGLSISDWNDTPNATCFLRATSGATPNRPPNTAGTYGWQLVSSDAGSYKQQFCANLADNAIYTRSYINGTWQAWQTLFHTGNLTPVETSRTLSAGDGLIGGGNLSANRTITLGTPGTLSGSTPNNASGSTHTHQLNIASTALAQAGNNDSALMTPIKTHAAFNQYGLGIDTAPRIADDLNNYYPSGLYYAFSAANSPGNGYVLYQHYSSDFASQLWISASSSRTCVRRKISGTWRNWEEIYTDANISPVDISRAINTGDGLTGGGNLSGNRTLSVDSSVARTDQFIRSGTQAGGQTISGDLRFQWGQATISASGDAQWVNFPNAFANACTSIVANHIGSGPAFVTIGNRERGRFEARVRRTDGVTSGALVICYIAMGY